MFKRVLFILLVLVLVLPVGQTLAQEVVVVDPVKLDETPRIAVLSAFDSELQLLLGRAEIGVTYVIAGRAFHVGTLAGNDVVMALTGVSIPNATATTHDVLTHFNVERIVYSGIAGGVSPELNIGDVAVPERWGLYLEAYFAREVEGEFVPPSWWEPEFGNFGMIYPSSTSVVVRGGEPDTYKEVFWYPTDMLMLEVARQVADTVELANCTSEGVCLENMPKVVVGSNGVSGQAFVDNAEFRDFVYVSLGEDPVAIVFVGVAALDMETAATGKEAYEAGVPWIAFRSLSDLAGGGPGENEIGTFFQLAADNSANVLYAFLEAWAAR